MRGHNSWKGGQGGKDKLKQTNCIVTFQPADLPIKTLWFVLFLFHGSCLNGILGAEEQCSSSGGSEYQQEPGGLSHGWQHRGL